MTIAIDPQISGAFDDGSADGAVRSKLVSGELIRMPFWPNEYSTEASGSTTVVVGSSFLMNPDGYGSFMNITVPPDNARSGGGFRLWLPFRGRIFGIRYQRLVSAMLVPFTVMVDGESFPVKPFPLWPRSENVTNLHHEAIFYVDDLPDGDHLAHIVLAADAFATRELYLFGYLVERRAGYRERPRTSILSQPAAVPTSSASNYIQQQGSASHISPRSFRQIIYHNTAASASVVTLYSQYGTTSSTYEIAKLYLAANGSAGDTAAFDCGTHLSFYDTSNYPLGHLASQAGVNFTLVGDPA